MTVIPETRREHQIRYLGFYYEPTILSLFYLQDLLFATRSLFLSKSKVNQTRYNQLYIATEIIRCLT